MGDHIWEPDFFIVIKFDVQIVSGDNADESHIFSGDTCFKWVGFHKLTKKMYFKKSLSLSIEAYLMMKSK